MVRMAVSPAVTLADPHRPSIVGNAATVQTIWKVWRIVLAVPKHLRQPTAPPELVAAVLRLREEYPCWGKDKLVVLLHEQGYQVSTSMVGRIIRRLKNRGVLKEPIRNHVSAP